MFVSFSCLSGLLVLHLVVLSCRFFFKNKYHLPTHCLKITVYFSPVTDEVNSQLPPFEINELIHVADLISLVITTFCEFW